VGHVQLPNRVLLLCSPCAPRLQVPCSASRVVPGAHRVVGPGTHRGSGPREVHTTKGKAKERREVGEGDDTITIEDTTDEEDGETP
jgi:hypothetical protein